MNEACMNIVRSNHCEPFAFGSDAGVALELKSHVIVLYVAHPDIVLQAQSLVMISPVPK